MAQANEVGMVQLLIDSKLKWGFKEIPKSSPIPFKNNPTQPKINGLGPVLAVWVQ